MWHELHCRQPTVSSGPTAWPCAQSPCLPLQDAWSDQKGWIHLDAQQDYQLLRAQRTPEGLSLLFKRPFGTCDPKDYLIEVGGSPTYLEDRGRRGPLTPPGAVSPRGDPKGSQAGTWQPGRGQLCCQPLLPPGSAPGWHRADRFLDAGPALKPLGLDWRGLGSPPGASSGGILERAQEPWIPSLALLPTSYEALGRSLPPWGLSLPVYKVKKGAG